MKIVSISPTLYTRELRATIAFYVDALGFELEGHDEHEGWAAVKHGDVRMMFSLPNAHVPFEKPTFTGSIYLSTDSVDAIWRKVKDKSVVVYPVEDFDYGMREFCILDNNGYMIQFGQEI